MEKFELIKQEGLISKETNEEKDFANDRITNGLTLRKRKINAFLSKQRGFDRFKNEGQKDYEITKEKLEIPNEIKNKKYDNIDEFLKEMKNYIQSENIEYNKYALYCIRVQTLNNEGINNKNIFSELLQKQDFISNILYLIEKYWNDKQIIAEGLWILINVLYYQRENVDLILYLSSQKNIQLYIKILEKKDNHLRFHLYWVLSNLLNNSNLELTNQVIFNLYMSSLFRLYIFKDLEDNNSKLIEKELDNLFNIIARLSDFINYTFIDLQNKNIKKFIDYNSNVDYQSILENNNYLFYHSMLIFMNNIENANLTSYCIYGISKLSNYLDDSIIYNKFFITGIFRKLIKEQIKVEELYIGNAIQIIGNYLFYTPETYLDPIIIEETLNYCLKLIKKYPNMQNLKRDIFWSISNISSVGYQNCEYLAKSGLLPYIFQSLYTDKDFVINEALFIILGFLDKQNSDIIFNYYHLDYIKNLILCLKKVYSKCKPGIPYNNMEILERTLECFISLFELENDNSSNKFVLDFEKNGGFEIIEAMLNGNNFSEKVSKIAEIILQYQKNN